ncbi:unnamed protein product [Fraxinus pennsylvanica]|uniref:Acyl-ACP thioesterase-like C-terminal domain-containing protein n=1 Tax=Fraxinus pennsylvanica TaxID=56036 RepID=A0AAD1YMQ6_9LAMI|nr:unnamed protein product [Fraxinus pennsylvanica]
MQSVPINVLEDYNLASMTLEYRRECRQSNVLKSLTSMRAKPAENKQLSTNTSERDDLECTHLLRMEADSAELVEEDPYGTSNNISSLKDRVNLELLVLIQFQQFMSRPKKCIFK